MKRYTFAIVSIILCTLFLNLLFNYLNYFNTIEKAYTECSAVNLSRGVSADKISDMLLLHDYVKTDEDAQFIAEQLAYKINCENVNYNNRLNALYDLQKRSWQVSAILIDSIGSPLLKERLQQSQISLGIDSSYYKADYSELPANITLNQGNGRISVFVGVKNASASLIQKIMQRKDSVCSGVIVRLSEHYIDSLENNEPKQRTVCYLKTDVNGQAVFNGLDPNGYYSVVPVKKGYEYGIPKGTIGGNLSECTEDGALNCTFWQEEHKVRLFDISTLKQIKEDKTLTVRSPEEFKNQLSTYLIAFFVVWWGAYWWLSRNKRQVSRGILSILMFLTGFCLLIMFSINDPLTDKLLGADMAQGIIVGVIMILLISNIDFVKLYQDKLKIGFDLPIELLKWIFKPFKLKVRYLTEKLSDSHTNMLLKTGILVIILVCIPLLLLDLIRLTSLSDRLNRLLDKQPKGCGYLFVALLLTSLLFTPLGVAVGGMKVNLNLGFLFQPSEIAKYLIIVFMAAYFSVNANNIVKYSVKGNTALFGSKLKTLFSIIVGIIFLIGLYLVLGDMGPALVLVFTFIILYSMIKSKIHIEESNIKNDLSKILTCDLAMLSYGIISFIAFLYFGHRLGYMGFGCILWFVVWIIIGLGRNHIFESPIFFNLILTVFIFGGQILSNVPYLKSIGERLESRNEMCTNTWGTLPIHGAVADAGENTQVAEGLWGIASGGLWGQGLGNGSPHFIPAFHTDMILESIGEQLGFIGIIAIVMLMALLLRKTILLGYRTSHPFTFYLCLGIAIVTAVQFIIIALGSTGFIPLTGVTVPFFSYGKVSMILNLTAFGIVLSVSQHNTTHKESERAEIIRLRKKNIGEYNYSVSIFSWTYSFLALIICGAFFYYQVVDRDNVLIKPVYVNNSNGIPTVEYNPRIDVITEKMYAGDIYDRNGILLATSNKKTLSQYNDIYKKYSLNGDTLKKQKRYYPFGEHLYFILGDINTKLFFSSSDKRPRGYMAEARHLAELRGYDNILRDKDGQPVKIDLYSNEYTPERYYAPNYSISQKGLQLRDYSALIPYLKAGINSDRITRLDNREEQLWNLGEIRPKDIQMTVDAVLQLKLQQRIQEYIDEQFRKRLWKPRTAWNKLRVSVVVLDAEQGDLLASANYPLPDYNILQTAPDTYSDNNKEEKWKAYTERDLGLTRPTAPGSTAKVMSALAGLRKIGVNVANPTNEQYYYYVDPNEKVGLEPTGIVTMQKAIVESSNCYFINLVNDYKLYADLAYIYSSVGVELKGEMPYCLNYSEYSPESDWINHVMEDEEAAVKAYDKYIKRGVKEKMYKHPAWFWTWGQGELWATPLAMARVASIVANDGRMPVTRYLTTQTPEYIEIVSPQEAEPLNQFMKEEANEKGFANLNIGGKTGTAERQLKNIYGHVSKPNDGWFICFIDNADIRKKANNERTVHRKSHLAIAVRMERLGSGMSGQAVNLTKEVVVDVLKDLEYID